MNRRLMHPRNAVNATLRLRSKPITGDRARSGTIRERSVRDPLAINSTIGYLTLTVAPYAARNGAAGW